MWAQILAGLLPHPAFTIRSTIKACTPDCERDEIFMQGEAARCALTITDCDCFRRGSEHFVLCSKSTSTEALVG